VKSLLDYYYAGTLLEGLISEQLNMCHTAKAPDGHSAACTTSKSAPYENKNMLPTCFLNHFLFLNFEFEPLLGYKIAFKQKIIYRLITFFILYQFKINITIFFC